MLGLWPTPHLRQRKEEQDLCFQFHRDSLSTPTLTPTPPARASLGNLSAAWGRGSRTLKVDSSGSGSRDAVDALLLHGSWRCMQGPRCGLSSPEQSEAVISLVLSLPSLSCQLALILTCHLEASVNKTAVFHQAGVKPHLLCSACVGRPGFGGPPVRLNHPLLGFQGLLNAYCLSEQSVSLLP